MMQLGGQCADVAVEPRPADHDRRRWREEDAAAGREVRRREQDVRPRRGRAAAKLCTLVRHCEAEGSDPATIRQTILGGGDPDGFLRSMEGYAKLGAEVIPVTSDPVGFVAQLGGTIVPRLAQIPLTDVAAGHPVLASRGLLVRG
jgi:hypothetical protein